MPRNRQSLGDLVVPGSAFSQRAGRAFKLCDAVPIPGDSPLPLHQVGDYFMFADESNLLRVVQYLSSLDSAYASSSAIHFAIDENLKRGRSMAEFDLPSRFKDAAAKTVAAQKKAANLSELKSRVHYVVASVRSVRNTPSEFAAFHHAGNEFVALDRVDAGSLDELNEMLQVAKSAKKLLIVPFDSMALASSHMCTIVIEPKRQSNAIVHIDPNEKFRPKSRFPFYESYRASVASSLKVLFQEFQSVFDSVSVYFRTIPNFNLPGAAPRNGVTHGAVEKKFLAYQLDRNVYNFAYKREAEGICAIVSLFVMVQTLCFGRRVLKDSFWEETFRSMSGSPLASRAIVAGVNRNKKCLAARRCSTRSTCEWCLCARWHGLSTSWRCRTKTTWPWADRLLCCIFTTRGS